MQPGVKLIGLRQLHKKLKDYDDGLKRELEVKLRDAGDIVATGAQQRFSAIDVRSAAGFRSRVKGFGRVVVEQRRRKTTGLRGDYGTLQMERALLPSRADNHQRVVDSMENMLQTLGRSF